MRIDLGDAQLEINLRVPGLRHFGFRLHAGAPRDTTAADRIIKGPPYGPTPRKVDFSMDLQADKQVELDGQWTDEVGNPADAPDGVTVTYTVDNPTVIALTDHGDGTATAAATGQLGTATVHAEASGGGQSLTGDLQFVVVTGLAERFNIVAGEPTAVTPDEPAPL